MVLQVAAVAAWILCCNAIGYWLNRTKLKDVAFPMPVILMLISVVLVSIWGMIMEPVHSFAEFVHILSTYGVKGIFCAVCATESYEIVHEWAKRKPQWVAVWKAVVSVFRREKNNG